MPRYFLYYAGLDSPQGIEQIGVAVSDDLRVWTRPRATPIIPLGSTGEGDALQTSNPCVLLEEGVFRMWYQGRGRDSKLNICYAESSDGVVWKANSEPVLRASKDNEGYRGGYQHPHVLFDRDSRRYRMWFTSQNGSSSTISYAESMDGLVWDKIIEGIVRPEAEWEGALLYYPFVTRSLSGYELWYTARGNGKIWSVGRATSHNGVLWIKDIENPILPKKTTSGIVRIIARYVKKAAPRLLKNAYGSASPFLLSIDGTDHLFTHDSGAGYRLSISHYVREKKENWVVVEHGVLESGKTDWDAYFQADPFILKL